MRIWIPATGIAAAMAVLVGVSIGEMSIPELQVRQVLAGEQPGVPIKLHGRIAAIHSEFDPLQFDICDKDDPTLVIRAQVDAVRPDLFKVDNDVAVEGVFDPESRKIVGDKIYTKCPSKYVASDEVAGAAEAATGDGYGTAGGYPSRPAAAANLDPRPADSGSRAD